MVSEYLYVVYNLICCVNMMLTEGGKELEPSDVVIVEKHKLVMIKHLRTVILDRTNYQAWRAQFEALLYRYELIDFIKKRMLLTSRLLIQQNLG